MNEKLLYFLWGHSRFYRKPLETVNGESLAVINPGVRNTNAGPDFSNALVIINGIQWAGSVEMHVKSSDWYAHHHEKNPSFDSVILHVVWEYDMPIYLKDSSELPAIQVKDFVSTDFLNEIKNLFSPKHTLLCDYFLSSTEPSIRDYWIQKVFVERLQRKTEDLWVGLKTLQNDWENLLFVLLGQNFGLHQNQVAFKNIASSIPFHVIRKLGHEPLAIESLFMGKAGLLLESEHAYAKELKQLYDYYCIRFDIDPRQVFPVQFYQQRPQAFPTIRLSQWAHLYSKRHQFFTDFVNATHVSQINELLQTQTSEFWETHFQFKEPDKPLKKRTHKLSKSFIDLITINVWAPVTFAYQQQMGFENQEQVWDVLSSLHAEQNHITQLFNALQWKADNAATSQGMIELKTKYCDKKRCLECGIAQDFLKKSEF